MAQARLLEAAAGGGAGAILTSVHHARNNASLSFERSIDRNCKPDFCTTGEPMEPRHSPIPSLFSITAASLSGNLEVTGAASLPRPSAPVSPTASASCCGLTALLLRDGSDGRRPAFSACSWVKCATTPTHITDRLHPRRLQSSTTASAAILSLDYTKAQLHAPWQHLDCAQCVLGGASVSDHFEVSGVASVSSLYVAGSASFRVSTVLSLRTGTQWQ